ncbi:MAG: hypothetical protein ACYSR6_03925 [Planctomycetota bacterium]|jgi:hypothetical protein
MPKIIKITVIMVIATVAVTHSSSIAEGGTPSISIYFDADLSTYGDNCPSAPPGTTIDTLYVVADSIGTPIKSIEYRVKLVPSLQYIEDLIPSGSSTGTTVTGITQSWPTPIDASSKFVVAMIIVVWLCDHCHPGNQHQLVCTDTHPATGYLRAMTDGDTWIYPNSWPGITCPASPIRRCVTSQTPVNPASWGEIKAIYD